MLSKSFDKIESSPGSSSFITHHENHKEVNTSRSASPVRIPNENITTNNTLRKNNMIRLRPCKKIRDLSCLQEKVLE